VALFYLLPAATRTSLIPANVGGQDLSLFVLNRSPVHDLGRGTSLAQKISHSTHRLMDILKEALVAGT
jgi:hypothetical protein